MVDWLYRNRIFSVKDVAKDRAIIVSEVPHLRKVDLAWVKDGKYFSQYVILLSTPSLNIIQINQCKRLDKIDPEEYVLVIEILIGRESDRLWRDINNEMDLYVKADAYFCSVLTRLSEMFSL